MVIIDRDHLNRQKTVATTTKKVTDQGQMRLRWEVNECCVVNCNVNCCWFGFGLDKQSDIWVKECRVLHERLICRFDAQLGCISHGCFNDSDFCSKPRGSEKGSIETIYLMSFTMCAPFPKVLKSQWESNSALQTVELPLITLLVLTVVSLWAHTLTLLAMWDHGAWQTPHWWPGHANNQSKLQPQDARAVWDRTSDLGRLREWWEKVLYLMPLTPAACQNVSHKWPIQTERGWNGGCGRRDRVGEETKSSMAKSRCSDFFSMASLARTMRQYNFTIAIFKSSVEIIGMLLLKA